MLLIIQMKTLSPLSEEAYITYRMSISSMKNGFIPLQNLFFIGIFLGLAWAWLSLSESASAGSRNAARDADIATIQSAIEQSMAKNLLTKRGENRSVNTTFGVFSTIRGATMERVSETSFPTGLLPKTPKDPSGAPYIIVYLGDLYQIFGGKEGKENQNTALVRGNFSNGVILDHLKIQLPNNEKTVSVYAPQRFLPGDTITIGGESMMITGITNDSLIVIRPIPLLHLAGESIVITKMITPPTLLQLNGKPITNGGDTLPYDPTL